jgi:hypothetical protein
MEELREQARRIKDRNDELEDQLQSKGTRRLSLTVDDGESLAAELSGSSLKRPSYDAAARVELEGTVRSAAQRTSTAPTDGRGAALQREVDNCRATIERCFCLLVFILVHLLLTHTHTHTHTHLPCHPRALAPHTHTHTQHTHTHTLAHSLAHQVDV